jgi:hypothetical protein
MQQARRRIDETSVVGNSAFAAQRTLADEMVRITHNAGDFPIATFDQDTACVVTITRACG